VENALETTHIKADGEIARVSFERLQDDMTADRWGTNKPYGREYMVDNLSLNGSSVLEWTLEREIWFTGLCQAFDILIKNLATLDNKEKLLECVASGIKFLSNSVPPPD